jgi:hypothetical protein
MGQLGRGTSRRQGHLDARLVDLTWRLSGLAASAAAAQVFDSVIARTLAQGLIIMSVTMVPQPRSWAGNEDPAQSDVPEPLAPATDAAGGDAAIPAWGSPPAPAPSPVPPPSRGVSRPLAAGSPLPEAVPGPFMVYLVYAWGGRVHVKAYEVTTVASGGGRGTLPERAAPSTRSSAA